MLFSFRVKDQCQAASHCPVYSEVAEAEVQPVVGVRGGVTARCGPLSLWPPFGKSAQIYISIYRSPGGSSYFAETTLLRDNVVSK